MGGFLTPTLDRLAVPKCNARAATPVGRETVENPEYSRLQTHYRAQVGQSDPCWGEKMVTRAPNSVAEYPKVQGPRGALLQRPRGREPDTGGAAPAMPYGTIGACAQTLPPRCCSFVSRASGTRLAHTSPREARWDRPAPNRGSQWRHTRRS